MTNAPPVPSTPRAATAASGPAPGSESGAPAIASGTSATVLTVITSADIPTGAIPVSLSLTMNPPIA